MSQVLSNFVRALRAQDVRVSISESVDAGRVAELVGFEDRQVLKDALSQVLAKTDDEKFAFNECFDQFFAFAQFKPPKLASNENEAASEQSQEDEGQAGEEGEEQDGEG